MSDLRFSVGQRIRTIRKTKGLTQQQLAELSGLDDAYIGSMERGERNFSIDTLEKVILALEIPATELFYVSENLDELQKSQRQAIDEYVVTLDGLSINQLEKLQRIIKEVRKAFE